MGRGCLQNGKWEIYRVGFFLFFNVPKKHEYTKRKVIIFLPHSIPLFVEKYSHINIVNPRNLLIILNFKTTF